MNIERTHSDCISPTTLRRQNRRYHGSGGRSQENHGAGFLPAFLDTLTGHAYLSCFADGSPAPFHMLDGLPGSLVAHRGSDGHVDAVRPDVVAGFLRKHQFYTRDQAAAAIAA